MTVRLVSQEELPGPLKGYRLIERLGRGGFGEVWKVEAPGGLLKAAKFVFGDLDAMDEDSRPAEQELKALKRVREIRHPYILSLERFDQIDGQLIIVMELADRNLWDRFRECRGQGLPGIPREELLRCMEEAAEALDLMNTHYQIQHLDIKPQNLFLVFGHVKVGDFGLAKLLEGVRATVTGGVTPVYAAPETFEGWVSHYSDQYSLSIVFQELLTGVRPFNGANTRQLLMQHINAAPDLNSLPPADRAIIGRGLAKKPDDRWSTCAEMVRALRGAGVPQAPPAPVAPAAPAITQLAGSASSHGADRPLPPPPQPQRPESMSGSPTQPAVHASAPHSLDSVQLTRVAQGGSAQLGTDPNTQTKTQTPQPGSLPPLMKPGVNAPPGSTPMPGSNYGPRLVTPSGATGAPSLTLQRPLVLQTGRMGSLGIAPPEKTGDGSLFPALVLAVGQTGKRVLEQYKHLVHERFGSPERVPNIRFLYIDTDPEAVPTIPSEHLAALAPREAVLARLNRFGHYLQRDSLPPVDPWMPPGALYKLSRNPDSAGGVRAFGRLALFDNYRLIAQRVRQEIETFLTDAPLGEADKVTKLGLRSNRPRAYIIAGLGGGTGGGMFLDLAFLLRHELRQVGYLRPDVVGMFFIPPADKSATRNSALGNTYASLAELHHFQAKKTRYQTVFDKSEAAVIDTESPFARVTILPLPKKMDPREQGAIAGQAARALFNETLTQTGRVTDEVRDMYRKVFPEVAPTGQTFGLFRLSWPRPEMLVASTRRFAQRQIQRWTGKEAAHLREPIAGWLAQQWDERNLALERMIESLQGSVRDALREEPDKVFDAFIDPLRTRTPSSGKLDASSACTVLDQLLKVVGKPDCENDPMPGSLHETLTSKYEQMLKEAEGHVAVMAATFLEVPQFRLPGAEEAIRQIGERLKQQVDVLEPLRASLDKEVRAAYGRLFQTIGSLSTTSGLGAISGRKASVSAEVMDLLRAYPRKRLQLRILDLVLSLYRRLLGNAPEYLREINFCRASLADLHAALAKAYPSSSKSTGESKLILPDGCEDLDGAADQFLAGLAPEDLLAFEQGLQKDIARKFKGLGSVCLKPLQKGTLFRDLLLNRSRTFLDDKLDHSDPATVFFRYRTDESTSQPLIGEAFGEAAPDLNVNKNGPDFHEINVLAAPPGEAGERFRELASRVLPTVELTAAPLPDDICFYREYPQFRLAELPQLGEYAREAYQHMATADHPPHARLDIPWQLPGQ
jgi:eukaryotic-like serine/threonine-protein kinase